MRKIQFVLLLTIIITTYLSAQVTFSVKSQSNFDIQGADLGINLGSLNPYLSLDLFGISSDFQFSTDYSDRNNNLYTLAYTDKDLTNGNANILLILPTIGARYFFSNKNIKPYITGNIFKAMILADIEYSIEDYNYNNNGTESQHTIYEFDNGILKETTTTFDTLGNIMNITNNETDLSKPLKEMVNTISPFGVGVGFGVQAGIVKNFSIFAEYNFRTYFFSSEYEYENSEIDNYGTLQWKENLSEKFSATLQMTSTAIGVRFKF